MEDESRAGAMPAAQLESRWDVNAVLALVNGVAVGLQVVYVATASVAVTSIVAAVSVTVTFLVLALRR